MHIEITYADGDVETVPVSLQADRVLGPGGTWRHATFAGNLPRL